MRSRDRAVLEPSFGPTSGVVSGWIGIVLAVVVVVTSLAQPAGIVTARVLVVCALGVTLIWSVLLRPRIVLREEGVLLRNVYLDTLVPYRLIGDVAVRTVTRVRVREGRSYVGVAVGRKMRELRQPPRTPRRREPAPSGPPPGHDNTPDLLEEQIAQRIERAGELPGAGHAPAGGPSASGPAGDRVTRSPAWAEIVLTVVLTIALVVVFA